MIRSVVKFDFKFCYSTEKPDCTIQSENGGDKKGLYIFKSDLPKNYVSVIQSKVRDKYLRTVCLNASRFSVSIKNIEYIKTFGDFVVDDVDFICEETDNEYFIRLKSETEIYDKKWMLYNQKLFMLPVYGFLGLCFYIVYKRL